MFRRKIITTPSALPSRLKLFATTGDLDVESYTYERRKISVKSYKRSVLVVFVRIAGADNTI